MPFRGFSDFCLEQELNRKRPQYCHYVVNRETRYSTVARMPHTYLKSRNQRPYNSNITYHVRALPLSSTLG
jgi:hypothetical protein